MHKHRRGRGLTLDTPDDPSALDKQQADLKLPLKDILQERSIERLTKENAAARASPSSIERLTKENAAMTELENGPCPWCCNLC